MGVKNKYTNNQYQVSFVLHSLLNYIRLLSMKKLGNTRFRLSVVFTSRFALILCYYCEYNVLLMSIHTKVDGPYRAMVLPASKDEVPNLNLFFFLLNNAIYRARELKSDMQFSILMEGDIFEISFFSKSDTIVWLN